MLEQTVRQLKQQKTEALGQIKGLQTKIRKLDQAIKALATLAGTTTSKKPKQTTKAKPAKRKMSTLGRLRIKLGALNRYGKKAEAQKLKARIAVLEAKAKKK